MRNSLTLGFILITFLAISTQAEPWNITRLGGITTDSFKNVKTVDSIAYCSTDFGLVLMDVSDKENPTVHSRIETNGSGREIEIRDSLLYFCDSYAGLKIFSISDPTEPILISECLDASGAGRILLHDNLAYLSCAGRMCIVDISDPFEPEQVGQLDGECNTIALLENYAYLAGGQIRVVDVEDPTNPEFLAWSEYAFTGEMTIQDEVLLGSLIHYSLENRLEPEQIYRRMPSAGNSHEIVDNILFIPVASREYRGLNLCGYNIENPAEPELEFVSQVSFTGNDLDYYEEYVYLTGGARGFSISDVHDWENIEEVGTYANYDGFRRLAIQNDYVYAFDSTGRLIVISIEDPTHPVEVFEEYWLDFSLMVPEMPMVTTDDYLYIYQNFDYEDEDGENQDRQGLYTYSLEDPEAPEMIHEISIPDIHEPFDLEIDGDFLYATSFFSGLMVFSIEDPDAPELLEIYEDYRKNFKLDVENDIVITCTRDNFGFDGIVIWDKSDPHNIEKLIEFDLDDMMLDVAIFGDYVYIISTGQEFFIVSIEDPANPEIISQARSPHYGFKLEEKDGFLYQSYREHGIEAFTLEDPENPVLIGSYDTPGYSKNFALRDNLLCLADRSDFGVYDVSRVQGLWYLDLSAESYYFDSTAVDSVTEWELMLTNLSGREREISEILFSDTTFSCQVETPFDIPAESDTTLTVTFAPVADSLYSSTLSVVGGESDLQVSLTGRGYLPNSVEENIATPFEFRLEEPYPNPFNSTVSLQYTIARKSAVQLDILDVSGRIVSILQDGKLPSGQYNAVWQANKMPSGIYFVRMTSEEFSQTRKMILVR